MRGYTCRLKPLRGTMMGTPAGRTSSRSIRRGSCSDIVCARLSGWCCSVWATSPTSITFSIGSGLKCDSVGALVPNVCQPASLWTPGNGNARVWSYTIPGFTSHTESMNAQSTVATKWRLSHRYQSMSCFAHTGQYSQPSTSSRQRCPRIFEESVAFSIHFTEVLPTLAAENVSLSSVTPFSSSRFSTTRSALVSGSDVGHSNESIGRKPLSNDGAAHTRSTACSPQATRSSVPPPCGFINVLLTRRGPRLKLADHSIFLKLAARCGVY
jgi:hypothetical protein